MSLRSTTSEITPELKIQNALTYMKELENSHEGVDVLRALKNLELLLVDRNIQTILAGNKELRQHFQNTYATCLGYVSTELTDVSRRLFINLSNLDSAENKDITAMPASQLALMNAYENLQGMVVNELVTTTNLDERTIVMERWVEIMHRALISGDFFTAKAVYLALEVSTAVVTLRATKEGLSLHAKKLLGTMFDQFGLPAKSLQNMRSRAPGTYIPNFIEYKTKIINIYDTYENVENGDAKPHVAKITAEIQTSIAAQIHLDTAKQIPSTALHRALLRTAPRNELEAQKEARIEALKALKAQNAKAEVIKEALKALITVQKEAETYAQRQAEKLSDSYEPKGAKIPSCTLFKQDEFSTFIISGADEQVVKTITKEMQHTLTVSKAEKYHKKLILLTSKYINDDPLSKRCRTVISDISAHIAIFNQNPEYINELIKYLETAAKDDTLKQQNGFGSVLDKVSKPKILVYIQRLLEIYRNETLNSSIKRLSVYSRNSSPAASPASSHSRLGLGMSPSSSSFNLSRSTPNGSFISLSGSTTPSDLSRAPTPVPSQPSASTIRRKNVQMSSTHSVIPSSSSRLVSVFVPPLQVPASPSSPAAKPTDSKRVNSPVTAIASARNTAINESVSKAEVKTPKSADRQHHRRHSASLTESQIVSANIEFESQDRKSKRNTMSEHDLKKLMGHSRHSNPSRRKSLDLSALQAVEKDTAAAASSARSTAEQAVKKDTTAGSVSARSTSDTKEVKRKSSMIKSSALINDQAGEERRLASPASSAAAQPSPRLKRERSKSNVAEVKKAADNKPATAKGPDVTDIEAKAIAAKAASKSFAEKFKAFETAKDNSQSGTTVTSAAPGNSHRGTEPRLKSSTGVEGAPPAVNTPHMPSRPASHSTGARQTSDRNLSATGGIVKTLSSGVVQQPTNSPRMPSRPASHSTGARQDSLRNLRTSGGDVLKVSSGNVDQKYTSSPRAPTRPLAHLADSRAPSERDLKASSGDTSSKQSNNSPRPLNSPTRSEKREKTFRELQGLFAAKAEPQTPANSPRITVTPASQQRSLSLRDVHTLTHDRKFTPPPAPRSSRDPNRLSLRAPLVRMHSAGSLRRHSVVASAAGTIRPSQTAAATATIRLSQKDKTDAVVAADSAKQGDKNKNGI